MAENTFIEGLEEAFKKVGYDVSKVSFELGKQANVVNNTTTTTPNTENTNVALPTFNVDEVIGSQMDNATIKEILKKYTDENINPILTTEDIIKLILNALRVTFSPSNAVDIDRLRVLTVGGEPDKLNDYDKSANWYPWMSYRGSNLVDTVEALIKQVELDRVRINELEAKLKKEVAIGDERPTNGEVIWVDTKSN